MKKRAAPVDAVDELLRTINGAIGHAASTLNAVYVQIQHARLTLDDMRRKRRAPAVGPRRRRRVGR